jgi:hypothetical protein
VKGGERLDIWVPADSAEVGSGEIEENIWGALDTTEEEEDASWWITWCGGAPVDPKHRVEHGDDFDFHTGREEEAEAHARKRDEELERLRTEGGERPEPMGREPSGGPIAATEEKPVPAQEDPQPEKKDTKTEPKGRTPEPKERKQDPRKTKPERKAQKVPNLEVQIEENGRK